MSAAADNAAVFASSGLLRRLTHDVPHRMRKLFICGLKITMCDGRAFVGCAHKFAGPLSSPSSPPRKPLPDSTKMAVIDVASIQAVTHHYAFLAALAVFMLVALYLVRRPEQIDDAQLLTMDSGPQPQTYRRLGGYQRSQEPSQYSAISSSLARIMQQFVRNGGDSTANRSSKSSWGTHAPLWSTHSMTRGKCSWAIRVQ